MYTQANSKNKHGGRRRAPKPFGGVGALEGTVTRVPANALTTNINSTNENTSIKAETL